MVSAISLSFFGGSSGSSSSSVDASLLVAWASAKARVPAATTAAPGADLNAPTPPWTPGYTPANTALAESALAGKDFFDPSAALYAELSMGEDYRQLFALYQGMKTMSALAERAEGTDLSTVMRTRTEQAFARGMAELEKYLAASDFDKVRIAQGDRADSATTKLGVPVITNDYTTSPLVKGTPSSIIPGMPNDAVFDIVAKTAGGTEKRVTIDLSELGSLPRSLSQIVSFANNKLAAENVLTRLETVNLAPKTRQVMIGGQSVTRAYIGPGEWALKVKVGAGETVRFEAAAPEPAFYVLGETSKGAALLKLEDTAGKGGQPAWLPRPDPTSDPIGALLATGFIGAGAPYTAAPASAIETKTLALVSDGETASEGSLKAAGEAVLKLSFEDGRTLTVSTGWRGGDQETWRVRPGETAELGMVDDLAERLTQLLHEQGVEAGVDSWASGADGGLSFYTGDGVRIESFQISSRPVTLEAGRAPAGGYVGGLRAGVFARRFETASVGAPSDLFTGAQTISITTANGLKQITVDGGTDGIDAATLQTRLNEKIVAQNIQANVSIVDDGGALKLRVDALHGVSAVEAKFNEATYAATLAAPGAWASGGLPTAGAGDPYGDSRRTYANTGASPFLSEAGALDIEIVVATPTGNKTVTVSVSAQERLDNPDAAPGQWNALLQQRLDAALNAAGVYVAAPGGDLSQFIVAEGAGQRLLSVSVNGNAVTYAADAPAFAVGGAFDARRSFTSSLAASGVNDVSAALVNDPTVSVTFETVWGTRTISASLQGGDARTLTVAAQRLNEALSAAGYDLGVAATDLGGGGAGLRVVSGASSTVSLVSDVTIGGAAHAVTLDAIDAVSRGDDPIGALGVSTRASRNAAVMAAGPANSFYQAGAFDSNWFAGRDFDKVLGQGAKVLAARATAMAPDGSVYVLADVSGVAGDTPVKGERDVALLRYDSTGRMLSARMLGAANEAQGFSLAVSSDGKVAVAGAVTGVLTGAGVDAGKSDAFVTLFDGEGKELWTQRRGGAGDDRITKIAFAPDGSLIATGATDKPLSGAQIGETDAFVRGYSASGAVMFTRQYGSSGADTAGALLVRDAGGGAVEIFAGGVENGRGVVRAFTFAATTGLAEGASRDLGNFFGGALTSLAHDGTSLYVGGAISADRLNVAGTARGAAAGMEGFIARMDDDLVSAGLDRATYLGSAQNDSVTDIAIVSGTVYALGKTGGVLAGQGFAKSENAFLARLDAEGDIDWSRPFSQSTTRLTPTSLAVDAGGASALDRLGLPKGDLAARDTTLLTARSGLRAGDEFFVGVDDGVKARIVVRADDTLQSLTRRIDSAISHGAAARIVRENGVDRIVITARDGRAVRIDPGAAGKSALGGLGLVEGIVSRKPADTSAVRSFGLGVSRGELSITTKDGITKAKAELAAALSIIRQAYEALSNPNAKEQTEEEKALEAKRNSGVAPTFLTRQLANYQTALARMGG